MRGHFTNSSKYMILNVVMSHK